MKLDLKCRIFGCQQPGVYDNYCTRCDRCFQRGFDYDLLMGLLPWLAYHFKEGATKLNESLSPVHHCPECKKLVWFHRRWTYCSMKCDLDAVPF